DLSEPSSADTPAKVNHAEAAFIAAVVAAVRCRECGSFGPSTVGIIVPYRNQIATVRTALAQQGIPADDISIDTVERYQGSQRKYIIYGFTVKRPGQLRFLTEHTFTDTDGAVVDRKLNVAMTRAREFLILVGNARLLSASPVFTSLIDYIRGKDAFFSL
ncbi:MAG: DNA helicase, partial [Muribaculaceae bacterium]|nr:DNA helicase [Muribaculaceae bacterium]